VARREVCHLGRHRRLLLPPADTFATVFGHTIDQVRAFTSKPVLLSQTAVSPGAGQPTKISDLFMGMRKYRTLGLVWVGKAQHGGVTHQDWRIEGDQVAEAAFRLAVAALTLAHP
jgi:mannan endo-1,4-beta-mannosidase